MPWLSILSGGLKLVNALVGYLDKKQLLDAGEAKAMARGLKITSNALARSRRIKATVTQENADDEL
jgi:hypothetical protein